MNDQTDKTAAERIAEMEAENAALREQLHTVEAMDGDRDTREARVRDSEKLNTKLKAQVQEVGLREAIRVAAEDLDIPIGIALMYTHNFTTSVEPDGSLKIEPSPYELLVKKVRTDPLLKRQAAPAGGTPGGGGTVSWTDLLANPSRVDNLSDENAVRLARYMDQNPELDCDLVRRSEQVGGGARAAWMRLMQQATRAGFTSRRR